MSRRTTRCGASQKPCIAAARPIVTDSSFNNATGKPALRSLLPLTFRLRFSVSSNEHIRAVAEYDDWWRLRPSILATALLAARYPDHPLRSAIQKGT
jgi:hypothetical protein